MSEVTVAAAPVAPAPAAPSAPAAQATTAPNTAPAEGGTAQNTADQAAAAQPDEKTETPDQAEKRGKSRFERRISRLHREAAEARAERDLLKRQLDELKPKPADDAATPRLEQFKDIEEYAAAKAKYAEEKALKDHTAKQQQESNRQAQAKLTEAWSEKVESASDKYEDWDEVVGELKPTSPWASAIMEAENGPDIAHYLGTNLKEAQRIASLPPLAQIREIGRLEEKLAAAPPQEKTPSKAPAPVKPLTGATPAEAPNMQDTADIGKWIKNRTKQVHGARR
jgi:chromosome segregation ATPase